MIYSKGDIIAAFVPIVEANDSLRDWIQNYHNRDENVLMHLLNTLNDAIKNFGMIDGINMFGE